MTCIVCVRHRGILYFGGDSISVSSYNKTINRDSKVFKRQRILFGTTGPLRLRNLLQYRLEIPEYLASESDPMTYLTHGFLDAVKECFKDNGFEQEEKGRHRFEGRFLLGFEDEFYEIGSEYDICRPAGSYCAIGVGEEYAYGSLHATEQMSMEPLQRLQMALEAAACYNTDVAGPFTFVTSEDDSPL